MTDTSSGSQSQLAVSVEGLGESEDTAKTGPASNTLKARIGRSGLSLSRRQEIVLKFVQDVRPLSEETGSGQQALLELVCFFKDGNCDYKELSRGEIFATANAAIPKLQKSKSKSSAGKPTLEGEGTLRYRDVRLLDTNYASAQDPTVAVRRHCLIIIMPPLRCLLLHDQVMLVVPEGSDAPLESFVKRFQGAGLIERSKGSFTLRVLETTFRTVSDTLQEQLNEIVPRVNSVVNGVQTVSSVSLTVLREVSADLARLLTRIQSVQRVYDELLASDSDMALMNLDEVHNDPQRYADENQENWEDDHNEIELLLESYAQSVDGVYAQAKQLEAEIESGVSVLMIQLDTARNNLLRVDLLVSCITGAAAIGALIAGIFGMNLKSELEDDSQSFWAVAGSLIAFTVAAVILSFSFIRRKGWITV